MGYKRGDVTDLLQMGLVVFLIDGSKNFMVRLFGQSYCQPH